MIYKQLATKTKHDTRSEEPELSVTYAKDLTLEKR